MIISDATSNKSIKKKILLALSAFGVLALIVLFLPKKTYTPKPQTPGTYYCDAEVVKDNKFFSSGVYFNGEINQSDEFARSGQYSCKLAKSEDNRYAFGFELQDFIPGETYKASVWRFRIKGGDDGFLNVNSEGEGKFHKSTGKIIKSIDDWELLEIHFQIPYYNKVDKVTIYVHTLGNYVIYFDDLLVQKTGKAKQSPPTWTAPNIHFELKEKAFKKLEQKRADALINGLLETGDDDWVKAKIIANKGQADTKVQMRLKGDWLDHLIGNKWSFRVKTNAATTYNRLRYFSLHTPKARSFLHEWVLHQLFEQEDVLTTSYDFATVELNKKQLGVYAMEEHFDKVLLERQKRREGPIVRFSEDGFWAGMKRHLLQFDAIDHDLDHTIKDPVAAPIEPFHVEKTLSSPLLQKQYEQASILMQQYKNAEIAASDIFDIQKIAQYYAICDALSAYHGTAWHNQRFYFNPVTSKLEPIGFDGFGEKVSRKDFLLGMGALNQNRVEKEKIENLLFLDAEFTAAYTMFLYKYTSRSFLEGFFASIGEELKVREKLIKTEFKNYSFNLEKLISNAQRMNALILPFDNFTIKAHVQKKETSTKTLKIANFHGLPIEIIGFGKTSSTILDSLETPQLLEAFYIRKVLSENKEDSLVSKYSFSDLKMAYNNQSPITYYSLDVAKNVEYLFYKTLGIDSIFHSKILNWKVADGLTVQQSIFKNINLMSNQIYSVSEDMVFFKKGKHQTKESIIIPNGYRVIFEAGCQLDFIKKAKFISKSPVFINGTEEEPVQIRSSDKTAQGFTVIQASQSSIIHYAIFDQFNTLNTKGWTLTGAVTFYESNVDISKSVFKNNVCEDGLNIIRSDFTFKNSQISNTFSDGLDADFCKGEINRSTFINTGNDGMDFSGSVILIDNTLVQNAGDKGVSVGEDSDAAIFNIQIKDSNTGLAAKDLSSISVKNIQLENCNQGFIAFQKKPEYGSAKIIIEKYTALNIKRLHNIRAGSTLQLEGKIIKGESLTTSN